MATTHQTNDSQNPEADIPSNYSRLIARELGLLARQLPGLLRGTGLDVAQFLSEDSLLTAAQQFRILRNALDLSGKPEFGLRLGARLTPATHGAMGFVACSSPDLITALQAIHTFLPTRANFIQLDLQQVEERLECVVNVQGPVDKAIHRCLADMAVKALLEFGEFIVGRPLHEAQICFAHQAPEDHTIYSDYLSGQIRFGCDQLKLILPMALCRKPNASANHENYRLAFQQCESMLARLQFRQPSYRTRVKKMMLSRPPGTLSEDEAAASLFMSKRTLARKLKQEHSGFRQIRDEILSQQAVGYLCDSQLSIEAIAALLNYHDTANFRRAFKRWFAQPPELHRQCAGLQARRPSGRASRDPTITET
ncbi:AraC family transcriptional regulator [Solimonas sp. SE-A11]|uniref:AraC family transcriptional regulator n=1 Tax=Solimonas sp. SE-A11 TaxID=3054954 RepID=UPI00259C7B2B|nr:AraC family transcriptional regulator [Solimonas sp. SE-A11]MDM4771467.1 AraC family transcriptional regulator ligand-binding domain-containing protein [Solimonas sp. SE-A11]